MPRAVITPWRDAAELAIVRDRLYRKGEFGHHDERQLAIDQIAGWKRKMKIAHAIESTALLVDAVLHGETASIFSTRAVYAAAFSRFVTGFCDVEQDGLAKIPMIEIAEDIGMPAHFVLMRHELAHRELPPLKELEAISKEGLEWLWSSYWVTINGVETVEEDKETQAKTQTTGRLKDDLRIVLKDYSNAKRRKSKTRNISADAKPEPAMDACQSCLKLCANLPEPLEVLADILVGTTEGSQDKMLIPSKRELGSSMDGAFLLWDELLIRLAVHMKSFLQVLIDSFLTTLNNTSHRNIEKDTTREALYEWLWHVLSDEKWLKAQDHLGLATTLRATAMESCILNPNHWSQRLGQLILENSSEDFQTRWMKLFESCQSGKVDVKMGNDTNESSSRILDQAVGNVWAEEDVDMEEPSDLSAPGEQEFGLQADDFVFEPFESRPIVPYPHKWHYKPIGIA